WDSGSKFRVRVEAIDNGKYLNDLPLKLSLAAEDKAPTAAADQPIPQIAPGRYELIVDAPRTRSFGTIRLADRVIDRTAIAARYAPEFDAVGNDYDGMRALAARTGGKMIDRSWKKPIEFPVPRRELDLTPWLAIAG